MKSYACIIFLGIILHLDGGGFVRLRQADLQGSDEIEDGDADPKQEDVLESKSTPDPAARQCDGD